MTIGHSTRTVDEFVSLLRANGVKRVVDVRSVPKSRHVPQFNREPLARSLRARGIAYVHLKDLGGRRHANKESANLGWRNASFRGFADYMATREFHSGLERLLKLTRSKRSAIMCAEALPWRCHRSLIADALLVRKIPVQDIIGPGKPRRHKLTPFAKVRGSQISYPG